MLKFRHHHFRYGTQACAVISVFVILLLLFLFSVAHQDKDNDVVLNPTLEEEAELTRRSISNVRSNQLSGSAYFFDHVSGAIRLSFHHKRSIQDWENYEEDNDRVGSTAQDRSNSAFASDDLPVDNQLRTEAVASDVEDPDPINNSILHDPDTTF
ncbi:hypothetical protein Dsin_003092 [Dipteronia sinensis]|uniref:Uncharacterized protein n=1 Tax=Dipteronia sinensis TaxID=43782 RepID=A0AAE0B7G2_9ROSI|nr:hypothetical protein Dsin_003092 [Dipteronia sinensis]